MNFGSKKKEMTLINFNCPLCGESISPKIGIPKITTSYSDCLRRCEKCEVGFSNSKINPTIIYKNHHKNVPALLRQDLDVALSNSINTFNRKNKINKFGFSTSEDALTWSFFKYFVIMSKFNELLDLLNVESNDKEFNIYLWGTSISKTNNESDFIEKFIQISDYFKELPTRRTEPDVIIELSDKLIFIEVKYLSQNEIKTNESLFTKYLISDIETEILLRSGHYELYRNWAFAANLSDGKNFQLINLGPKKLFNDKNRDMLSQFEKSLKSVNGKFVKMSWEEIVEKINNSEYETWFKSYLNEKILPTANKG